ncbi:MAG TPA: hypothetical protein RMH99_07260 [Sandaracinaceae bacterium LLY-WYZ-13_1]|nr:hypothetical protein [Sandaracinaceae bacterium LLY-WYZ-13_1]
MSNRNRRSTRLPWSRRIIAFGVLSALAVAAAVFSVFWYALDVSSGDDPTAQGLIDEEVVPARLLEEVEPPEGE